MNARLRIMAAGVATVWTFLAAGCGISAEPNARGVQPPAGPYVLPTPSPPRSPSGQAVERLYFVRGGSLIEVLRRVSDPGTVESQLNDLLAGPTDHEQSSGLTSALPGNNIIGGITIDAGVATVILADDADDVGRTDEVLAFGQVVCTLDGRIDVDGVAFVQNGQPAAVPLATGLLSAGPLTTADYASLISPS